MKVIQFINGLTTGGAETLVKDYVLHFPADVTPVVVLTNPYTGSPHEDAIRKSGIKIISISERLGWNETRRILPIRAYRFLMEKHLFIREFKRILQEEQPDAIHAHLSVLHILEGCIQELQGIRLIYTCHSEASVIFRPERKDFIRAAKKLVLCCDMHIIALHERMARELNTFFGKDVSFPVNNCIDCRRFREPEIDRTSFRQSLGIPTDAYVLGHIGRFVKEKNHSFLVEVFQQLRHRDPRTYLVMIGAGPLQQQIQDQLAACGLQDHSLILQNRGDIPQLMKAMDVFVFPSLYEGFPIVLLEAQAAGLKCVISDKISDATWLTDLVVPVSLEESPAHWCDVILSPQSREPGNLARLEEYDVHTVVRRLRDIYNGSNG